MGKREGVGERQYLCIATLNADRQIYPSRCYSLCNIHSIYPNLTRSRTGHHDTERRSITACRERGSESVPPGGSRSSTRRKAHHGDGTGTALVGHELVIRSDGVGCSRASIQRLGQCLRDGASIGIVGGHQVRKEGIAAPGVSAPTAGEIVTSPGDDAAVTATESLLYGPGGEGIAFEATVLDDGGSGVASGRCGGRGRRCGRCCG